MSYKIIKNARLVNEGQIQEQEVLIKNNRIEKIASSIDVKHEAEIIDLHGNYLFPGLIDTHVHFREPGLTHKGSISSESLAAVFGGITTFMEMPNTIPQTITLDHWNDKLNLAAEKAFCNYSFYFGATNDNLHEIEKIDPTKTGALKIFMGSSTGNMLVDDKKTLEQIFDRCPTLIAVHAEVEEIIEENFKKAKQKWGDDMPPEAHAFIRNEEGCVESSKLAIELAKKHEARLHILHLTTAEEVSLFQKVFDESKRITTEVCPHHLWFSTDDYAEYGNKIKCNPAIKGSHNKKGLLEGLKEGYIDMVVSDHAPHLPSEKEQPYLKAAAGIPTVQHTFNMMQEIAGKNDIQLTELVKWMSHRQADLYRIKERGYLREGYYADLTVYNPDSEWQVNKDNIKYKCQWSPIEGHIFKGRFEKTFVNGELVYDLENSSKNKQGAGMALEFSSHF